MERSSLLAAGASHSWSSCAGLAVCPASGTLRSTASIEIARALYKRPSLFVFDEATSALDTDSERAIQDNLARRFDGATVFIIAHRLSTVRDADRIIVLEHGAIVEQGTHAQLSERQGLYYELVRRQGES